MKRTIIITLLFIISGTINLNGQDSLNYSKLKQSLSTLIQEKIQNNNLVGVAIGLVLNDSVVWSEGYGFSNLKEQTPFTPYTAMAIGSITKTFTALGIMQLHERKLLNINSSITKYLPQFRIRSRSINKKEITVSSILQHTSGLPNDYYLTTWNQGELYTSTVNDIKNEYLAFPPSLFFHYSNIGYTLLGHIIYNVSKTDYPLYIKQNILDKIGMCNSGFLGYTPLQNISLTYDTAKNQFPLETGKNIPAGALFSTINDLIKYAKELINIYHGKTRGVLKRETLNLVDIINDSSITNFNSAIGWEIFKNDTSSVIFHLGSYHVTNAVLAIDLKHKNAIIVFANTAGGMELVNEALSIFTQNAGVSSSDIIHISQPEPVSPLPDSIKYLSHLTGLYANTSLTHAISCENDQLKLESPYGNFILKPISDKVFIPGIIVGGDSIKWLTKSRFIIKEIQGYTVLIWQDASGKRQLLGQQIKLNTISANWKNRFGKYKIHDFNIHSWEKYLEFTLHEAKNGLLQLEISCTSGNYQYYLKVINEDEAVICGFDEQGGETIRFRSEQNKELMIYMGIPVIKI